MRQRKGFSDALDEGLYPSLILVPVDECDHEGYWAPIMCCGLRYTLDISILTHWKGDCKIYTLFKLAFVPTLSDPLYSKGDYEQDMCILLLLFNLTPKAILESQHHFFLFKCCKLKPER